MCTTCLQEHAPQLMTPREAAELLRVSDQTIYRLCEAGELPKINVGRSFRIRAADVYQILEPLMSDATS